MQQYAPILIFLAVAVSFPAVTFAISALFQPKGHTDRTPYECGIEPASEARDRYSIQYYIIAVLFVVFDVETIFLFPWAVKLNQLAMFGFIEMAVFFLILVVGYLYAWKKGALEWVS